MESKYEKAINKYYHYKKIYENERTDIKDALLRNDSYSMNEKKEKLKMVKQKCLFCNRKVNMKFFKDKDSVLHAECGDNDSPCDKRIEIQTSRYELISNMIEDYSTDIKTITGNIIDLKTQLVLGLDDSEEILSTFEDVLEDYNETYEIFNRLKYRKGKTSLHVHEEDLKQLKYSLQEQITKIKLIHDEYMSSEIRDDKQITEITNIYKEFIIPLEEQISSLTFRTREINTVDKDHYLKVYRENIHDNELVYSTEDPEVLRFDPPLDIPKENRRRKKKQQRQNAKTDDNDNDDVENNRTGGKDIDCEVK